MERKHAMDVPGAIGLVGFALLLAINQVVIKLSNDGLAPVFAAGVRSALALGVLGLWIVLARRPASGMRDTIVSGLVLGVVFSFEFLFLFMALDLTTVSRASIVFYSMPVWLALVAHFILPGEKLSTRRIVGLGLAMGGVIWALADPNSRNAGHWGGDVLALCAALAWAGIALLVRLTKVSTLPAESQLLWQLATSAILLTALSPLFGPVWRDLDWTHVAGLVFQAVCVASLGFLFWLRLMSIYPASDIAAFSFLSPVLAVGLGWLVLDEPVGPGFVGALVLVSVGVVLINRRRKRP